MSLLLVGLMGIGTLVRGDYGAGLLQIGVQALLLAFVIEGLGDEERNPAGVVATWAAGTVANVAILAYVV